MDEKRVYLLAQFDETANKTLAAIYDRLTEAGLTGGQTKGIPYHITLGSYDTACAQRVLERAKALCPVTRAFEIGLTHIGLFSLRVLFLAPSINSQLNGLYRALTPDAPIEGCHDWVPHATLLLDEPENIQRALPIVASSFTPFTARIDSVGVYEFFPKALLAEYRLAP